MKNITNLHIESIYLQGARALLLAIENQGGLIAMHKGREGEIYDKAVFEELLHNREFLLHFLEQGSWEYYGHERNKKNKLVNVKVKF